MILTGPAIQRAVNRGDIVIEPFEASHLGPNSYDFRLGHRCLVYRDSVLDAARENLTTEILLSKTGLTLEPSRLYLFNTLEVMGSTRYVPIIRGRSSLARLGVFIDITADLIDVGSINQWTLQLHAILPTRVYPGMRVGQVTFWCLKGDVQLYNGRYAKHRSPVASLSFLDFPERVADNEDEDKRERRSNSF